MKVVEDKQRTVGIPGLELRSQPRDGYNLPRSHSDT